LCLMRYEYDVPTWRLNNFLAMVEIGGGDSGGSEWGEGRDEDSTSPHCTIAYIAWSYSVRGPGTE
jgi:hypothetical protein